MSTSNTNIVADIEIRKETAAKAGAAAYWAEKSCYPALDPTVIGLIADLRVGTGAVEVMRAYKKGWHDACDAQLLQIINKKPSRFAAERAERSTR